MRLLTFILTMKGDCEGRKLVAIFAIHRVSNCIVELEQIKTTEDTASHYCLLIHNSVSHFNEALTISYSVLKILLRPAFYDINYFSALSLED